MKFLTILAAALLVAAPVHAGPVAAAVGAVVSVFSAGGALAAGTFLGTVARFAISAGASLLSQALNKPKTQADRGVTLDAQIGDAVPETFVVGVYATGGRRKYAGSWGGSNEFYVDVVELSSIPVTGLAGVWIDDERFDFSGNGSDQAGAPLAKYNGNGNRLWVKFYDGTQTAADPYLVDKFGADPDHPWPATSTFKGRAYAVITWRYDKETAPSFPQFSFEVQGIPCYDLRKDSTAGGSGAHRWNDPATWEFSENPAVIGYTVARGIYYGSTWVFGGQNLAAARLPASAWIAAANEHDAEVSLSGGGTEPAHRVGLEIDVSSDALDMLEAIGKSSNMQFSEVGGAIKPIVGVPGSPVLAITDESIVVSDPSTLQPFPGLDQTYNALRATYPEPAEKWSSKDAPEFRDADLIDADGRYLPASMTYSACPFATQVQRLMRAQLLSYRRFRRHQIQLPPEAASLEPFVDTIQWTSEINGYVNKSFIVEAVTLAEGGTVAVSLREVDPGDYDWSSAYQQPTGITPITTTTYVPPVIAGWSVDRATIKDNNGVDRIPAIKVTCAGGRYDVAFIRVQARLDGGAVIYDSGSVPYDPVVDPYSVVINGNFTPVTDYEVRGKFVSDNGQQWSAWLPVTTTDTRIGAADLADAILDAIDDAQQAADDASDRADSVLEYAQAQSTDVRAKFDVAAQHVLAEIVSRNAQSDDTQGDLAAYHQDAFVKFAEGQEALVGLRTELLARIGDNESSIDDVQTAYANADQALADDITALSATVGTISSTVDTQGTAIALINGYASATYTLRIAAGGASAGFEFVAADDPISGPASNVRINGQNIKLDGDVEVTGTFLTDTLIGTSAWIKSAMIGTAEIKSANIEDLSVDTIKLAHGSVTESVDYSVAVGGYGDPEQLVYSFNLNVEDDSIVIMSCKDARIDPRAGAPTGDNSPAYFRVQVRNRESFYVYCGTPNADGGVVWEYPGNQPAPPVMSSLDAGNNLIKVYQGSMDTNSNFLTFALTYFKR
ncbi:hypothetical protein DL1_11990 [Thioclava dalianensis]|uniref:Tip attachment protein J domain-containing protein n=1 Tax=Thioclava dalianensis TaxID=1185766 RepID=A0A074T9Q4_9RHOB|nr:hypothetical protein [Thioclava dalianensis]KEP68419.1 hypothetical protein DL1_11990 [Thioclava dalianensis]SFN62940.1 hypothetical protein SAMN05216224_10861 [Thioclava dalianensis]